MIGVPSSVVTVLVDPLPDLRARDLGGRGILHEVVDRRPRRARAATTRCSGSPTETLSCTPASVTSPPADGMSSSCGGRDLDVVALPVELVRPVAEHRVELRQRGRDQVGVRHPGAVEAVAGLAPLVGRDLRRAPAR